MKYLPFIVVVVVLAVGTLIEGKLSDRWGRESSEKLITFTERLNDVPMQFGDWVGVDDPINEEEFKMSNCTGCVSRTYTNREGQRVNVYLVAGSARHVTIHTPDWCYVGAGYVMEEQPQQYSLIDTPEMATPPEFLTTRFLKEDALATHYIRIFWSFSDDGVWRGPRQPKPAFAGRPALFKAYFITEINGTSIPRSIEGNPTLEFAREFLPMINKHLFKKDQGGQGATT